jgi:hypothetical protein
MFNQENDDFFDYTNLNCSSDGLGLNGVGPYPTPKEDCPFNALVIIATFGITGIAFGIRFRKDSSFFTVSIVMIWQIYLMWSALAA